MSTAAALIEQAKASLAALTPAQFAVLAATPGTVVVDVREPDERVASGSIRGARHVPRGVLEFHADPASPHHDAAIRPDIRVLLYCSDGGRSALAAAALRALGYHDVAHLDGGVETWAAAGYRLEGMMGSPY